MHASVALSKPIAYFILTFKLGWDCVGNEMRAGIRPVRVVKN